MTTTNISAYTNDKVMQSPEKALKAELQREGLKQATEFSEMQASKVSLSANQTLVSLSVYQRSMQQNVVLDGRKNSELPAKNDVERKSAFDFEKVASNVMRFVGSVINSEANSGASEERLTNLFEQARSGITKGISMAQRDIGELMNDEVSQGIAKSKDLMDERLEALENKLLGNSGAQEVNSSVSSTSVLSSQSGELKIRTRDGDELFILFESNYSASMAKGMQESQVGNVSNNATMFQSTELSNNVKFSIRVDGELDDGEQKAISTLIEQIYDLADTFFAGNLDDAFSQALSLGYDESELTGYAMQLKNLQQREVVKAYETVKHYTEGNIYSKGNDYGDIAKPFAQYMEKLFSTLENSTNLLSSNAEYTKIANGLIGEMTEIQVPDLISAINRFHSFNGRLMTAQQR